ncbi:uncharacterized mitochondrial protein-like protein [Tanacetum coccineum]
MVPRTVLTRSGLISLNTARPVNTVQPRTTVNNARPMKNVINNAYSTARRPFNKITTDNNSNPQQYLKDKGVIDSGCSRHMIGNRSYLINYEEINGGFVTFGGNSKGRKITGKDFKLTDRVYKVEKALYGLHQAPKAWYETLSTYLLDNGFQRGKIDKTLFIRRVKSDILLVQVYVDDIIFGSTKKSLCIKFEKMMHKKFQISYTGELTFFLGLQVKQKEDGIFISQDKYVTEILKKFGFTDVKTTTTPIETHKPLLKNADGEDVDKHLYRSMIGSLMYLTSLRPDIMFAVCACARYQVNPKVSYLHAVKRIFRYLKG